MEELNKFQTDVLSECINIGIGDAASTLSELTGKEINLFAPKVKALKLTSVKEYLDNFHDKWHNCAVLKFTSKFCGDAALIFNLDASHGWADLISNHQFGDDIDITEDMKNDFLLEIGNILINGCIGSLSNLMGVECDFSVPQLYRRNCVISEEKLAENNNECFGLIITATLQAEGKTFATDLFLTIKEESVPFLIESMEKYAS